MINTGMAATNQVVMVRGMMPHHPTGVRAGSGVGRVASLGVSDQLDEQAG
jgi:hypothetical protein